MKKLLISALMPIVLFAECNYKIKAEIFPKKQSIQVDANIQNSKVDLNESNFSYEKTLKEQIGENFIFLADGWLPPAHSLCRYELNLTLPKEFIVISESEDITKKYNDDKVTYNFKMQKPIDSINIIASKDFVLNSEDFNGVLISTYFFKKHANLSESYIEKVKEYIQMYEKMLGAFPYKRFSVVENSFQTGYSMPTYTLIGDKILDKPFLVNISLGHEILHQWFGNSVFNDFSEGNWVEGITTYLSDHYYKELDGKGWEYRKKILDDYETYVNKNNLINLSEFRHRSDRATMVIGYGKGAFAFHSLRVAIGDEAFFKAVNEFYKAYKGKHATYHDIGEFFDKYSDKNSSEIIHNIFEHKDIVDFNPTGFNIGYEDGAYKLEFDIAHDKNISHSYTLPLLVKTEDKNESFNIFVNGDTNVSLRVEDKPLELIFDRDYDLFRTLSQDESIPNLAKLFGDNNLTIVTDSEDEFEKIKEAFQNSIQIKKDDLTFKQMQEHNILFLADAKDLAEKSLVDLPEDQKGFTIICQKNPWNRKKVVSYIYSSDEKEQKSVLRKLKRYSKESNLHFVGGKLVKKSTIQTQRGKTYKIAKEQQGVKTSKNLNLNDIVKEIEDKKVIFIGESHTNFAHHINQLNIIKALFEKGKKVAIGLEMFQRRFQPVLDDYISGKIDEKTFLKDSQYFTRWKYNYNLYRPIIEYAKRNKIPIIALNLEKEIIKKVTKKGFYALSEKEKNSLPKSLDFTNQTYKENLLKIFNSTAHMNALAKNGKHEVNPEFIYQSQIIWDETMAESISKYLNKHSDIDSFVVLAGVGHIESFHGIASRVFRRVNLPFSVIVQDIPVSEKVADFALYTQPLKVKEPLKIGVYLDTKENLKVTKVIKNTIADELGIRKDDIILSVDKQDVKTLEELKYILFFKDKDKNIDIKLKRKEKILNLQISL